MDDDADVVGILLAGDFTGEECSAVTLRESRVAGAAFTGSRLRGATFIDCEIIDTDPCGAVLEECRFERVEFRHRRMSGIQAQGSHLRDVALLDCKVDSANFRLTVWERGELRDSYLVASDFMVPGYPDAASTDAISPTSSSPSAT